MRKVRNLIRRDIEKFRVPRSLQQLIPVKKIFEDGMFLLTDKRYSKSYELRDINFAGLSEENKETMRKRYKAILNALPSDVSSKLTINKRVMNLEEYRDRMCIRLTGDANDKYRSEYNQAIMESAAMANNMVKEIYLTITVGKRNEEEARNALNNIEKDIAPMLGKIGSTMHEIKSIDRLKIIYDFFNPDKVEQFAFTKEKEGDIGDSFKNYLLPNVIKNEKNELEIGDRYARVLYMMNSKSSIGDEMINKLMEINAGIMVSVECVPVPTDQAIKIVEEIMLEVESNREKYFQRMIRNNNFFGEVPSRLNMSIQDVQEVLDQLYKNDETLIFATITIIHTADSLEKLDSDTNEIESAVAKYATIGKLSYQQLDGLVSTLPFGVKRLELYRTYTSESLSGVIPFNSMEVQHPGGVFFGINSKSKNVITINRENLLNGNAFILGSPGSGKSFAAKKEIAFLYLSNPNADIVIVDPEREYTAMVKALGGEAIEISSVSKNHLNPMEMNNAYGDDDDAISLKTEFLLSVYEQIAEGRVTPAERTVISRCVEAVYFRAEKAGKTPTLIDLYDKIMEQPEHEAKRIALNMELFVTGQLDCFAHERNVDAYNRLVSYDILQLSEQLRPLGMLVVLDSIWNRITQNRSSGRDTYVFIDEIYLLFVHEFSAMFLDKLWRRVRKYGGNCTGITQNITPMLLSSTASSMLSNSEYLVMFNQKGEDANRLSAMLNLSQDEESEIKDTGEYGKGLLRIGSSMIAFKNVFPARTELYELMSTKFSERKAGMEV